MPALTAVLGLFVWLQVFGAASAAQKSDVGCIECHAGIEAMHPEAELGCVDCHGGDGAARAKAAAHVAFQESAEADERVPPLDRNLAGIRFQNPMDLRVLERTCSTCHEDACSRLLSSLHGTTAGHLSDGYYEMGLLPTRGSKYSVFPKSDAPLAGGEVKALVQPPAFQDRGPATLAHHYGDLPRKECMQCHLWSEGRAVRGRIGFDGDYRGSGCAACHVAYATDGLSRSEDKSAEHAQPGHPLRHAMSAAPATDACVACHYGDASIGLQFRGLAQLPPNAPGGPQVPGTTEKQLNRVFYLNDPSIVPPDIHHEKGMHCIDCHTAGDVMGDGRLHGQMEHAVEISCSACHGTFLEEATLRTERGTPLAHVRREGERVVLRSKVDGREHEIPQAARVIDPARPEYNAHAALAMTAAHAKIECYTCHSAWNANYLGFHFSRREQLTQLDLLSGKRTPGRVTTQEKVFASWKSFYAGLDEKGALAPYLTGFSTMGSVWDEEGRRIVDQEMPVTAAGLSGMSMIHHQPHSIRPTARECVECHRAPGTFGLGTPNFRLARRLAFVGDRRGLELIAIDRGGFTRSAALAKLPIPDVTDVVLRCEPLQGHAEFAFVGEGGKGIHSVDVRDPAHPKRAGFLATVDPCGLELAGELLFVADGIGGLKILRSDARGRLELLGEVPTCDAQDVDVQWPWAYVADGVGGLCVIDIRDPAKPEFLASHALSAPAGLPSAAIAVETLFQYSRPVAKADLPEDRRIHARNLAAVLDRNVGLYLIDVTEPTEPRRLSPPPGERPRAPNARLSYRGLGLLSQVDLADPQGGERTAERDYVYVLQERGDGSQRRSSLTLVDVSDPLRISGRKFPELSAGFSTEQLVLADYYSEPTRRRIAFSAGELGVQVADLSTSRQPNRIGDLPWMKDAYAVAVEEFALDRMVDENGRPQKDVSHEGSRWLKRAEIERILAVEAHELDDRSAEDAPDPQAPAREAFGRLDKNGSGMLDGEERKLWSAPDLDGDERLSFGEYCLACGLVPASATAAGSPTLDRDRILAQLTKLLDGSDPYPFDADGKGLSRPEAQRAVFAALDLDKDQKLSLDEFSRAPGPGRMLRYQDSAAKALARSVDKNGDGFVSEREFVLDDALWNALDRDGNGVLALVAPDLPAQKARGLTLPGSEWPSSRDDLVLLSPGITTEALFALFDKDQDELLERRELRAREDLLALFDSSKDGTLDPGEVSRKLGLLEKEGVHSLADDFEGRWDLDGNGTVEPAELPEAARWTIPPR